jgi:hypothetical protein
MCDLEYTTRRPSPEFAGRTHDGGSVVVVGGGGWVSVTWACVPRCGVSPVGGLGSSITSGGAVVVVVVVVLVVVVVVGAVVVVESEANDSTIVVVVVVVVVVIVDSPPSWAAAVAPVASTLAPTNVTAATRPNSARMAADPTALRGRVASDRGRTGRPVS